MARAARRSPRSILPDRPVAKWATFLVTVFGVPSLAIGYWTWIQPSGQAERSHAPPNVVLSGPSPIVTSSTTMLPPMAGEWRARPGNAELTGCSDTVRADNLYWNICVSGARAVVVATVSSGPSHLVSVPKISTFVNGTYSRGIACPPKLVNTSTNLACFAELQELSPGQNVQAYGRLDHDDVEGTFLYSGVVRL